MSYINGLQSLAHASQHKSWMRNRVSIELWENSLALAERGHVHLRKAARLSGQDRVNEADSIAMEGIDLI